MRHIDDDGEGFLEGEIATLRVVIVACDGVDECACQCRAESSVSSRTSRKRPIACDGPVVQDLASTSYPIAVSTTHASPLRVVMSWKEGDVGVFVLFSSHACRQYPGAPLVAFPTARPCPIILVEFSPQ